MTKERIEYLIKMLPKYKTVKEIEVEAKLPPTTLQKALKGERGLPKKWEKPLEAYFGVQIQTGDNSPKIQQTGENKPQNGPQAEIKKPFMSDAIKKKLGIK